MLTCTKCQTEKPETEFSFRNKETGQRRRWCKICQALYAKNHYKSNPIAYQAGVKRRREAIKNYIREQKSQPCEDCHQSFPWYVMDFDHLEDKKFNISSMAVQTCSLRLVKIEIAKCEVVCSNCHRIRTYNRAAAEVPHS